MADDHVDMQVAYEEINDAKVPSGLVRKRCNKEILAVSGNANLSKDERKQKVQELRDLRDDAEDTLQQLDRDQDRLVVGSSYGRKAVENLSKSTDDLTAAVENTTELAKRRAKVAELLGKVSAASKAVLKAVKR